MICRKKVLKISNQIFAAIMGDMVAFLKYIAIAGNILYILWILYNAIDEGFNARPLEKIVLSGLLMLLVTNTAVILSKIKQR